MTNIQNIYDNPIFFESYQSLRNNDQGFNNLLEQPTIYSLLPCLKEKNILDIGCGFGDFSRYALKNDASSVLGIDPSFKMLQKAQSLTMSNQNIIFKQVAIENFEADENSFDLIVSSLAFHYVRDFKIIIKHITRWLKPNCCLIFSVEHPICTACPEAILKTDEQGKIFHPVYNYRDETAFKQTWFVEGVQKYHRTISTYVNTLIELGLRINAVLEPMPDDELLNQKKEFAAHKIRPPLLIIKSTNIK